MSKKKIPTIVKQIKKYKPREVNYAFEKAISYSQMSMFLTCPHKWALQYRDGYYTSESSINMTFGTSLHETLQHYISTIYEDSAVVADDLDLESYFEERFRETYTKDYKSNKNIHFSNPAEMREFYDDGVAILDFIKKKRGEYFSKKGWHLIGCEVPILLNPHPDYKNVLYKGFLDIVLYHEGTNKFKIIDIKTSRQGWNSETKKDETKQLQLVLYKKFFAQQFNVPEDDIEIEFFIVKRKLWEESPYPVSRIQQFIPASGKVKMNKAKISISKFIEEVFNSDGSYKTTPFEPNPSSKNCKYCPFSKNKELCPKSISS